MIHLRQRVAQLRVRHLSAACWRRPTLPAGQVRTLRVLRLNHPAAAGRVVIEQMVESIQPPLIPWDMAEPDGAETDAPPNGAPQLSLARHSKTRTKHPRNTLNELSGDEWIFFTKSVLTTAYPSGYGHQARKAHGANKPPQLMRSLIEFFTAAGGHVLDPFAGVGGTLLGAAIATPPRLCTGIEINPAWAEVYRKVIRQSAGAIEEGTLHVGDCLTLLDDRALFPDETYDFICTDPPYNVHLEQTMSNDGRYAASYANRRTDYNMRSDHSADLANAPDYETYLNALQQVLKRCFRVLKTGKYLAIILRNAYQNGRYSFTHVDVARRAEQEGFVTKGEVVWYQAGTRLRPYGYPFAYVPNITHQFIVILHKPRVAPARGRGTPRRVRRAATTINAPDAGVARPAGEGAPG